MRMNKYVILLCIPFLSACLFNPQEKKELVDKNVFDFKHPQQALLTNNFLLTGEEEVLGAGSFLIAGKKDTFLCTARHLMGLATGLSREYSVDSFNLTLQYWKAYPRVCDSVCDTVFAETVVFAKEDEDIILLKTKNKPKGYAVLFPSYDKLIEDDLLTILACEYQHSDCKQQVYNAHVLEYKDGFLTAYTTNFAKTSMEGFSGSPVLNGQGKVIGLVRTGTFSGLGMAIIIETLESAKNKLEGK